jgi:hypothetical protein
MIKCDICGEKANRRLFTTSIEKDEPRCIAEICEKCEAELAEAVILVANRRMREKYGDKALTIMPKQGQAESEEE